jgi:hypothetical protein
MGGGAAEQALRVHGARHREPLVLMAKGIVLVILLKHSRILIRLYL